MKVWVQTAGTKPMQDYTWVVLSNSSTLGYQVESPDEFISRNKDLLSLEKFGILFVRHNEKLSLLITGIDSEIRSVYRPNPQPIRYSILWQQENSDESEDLFKGILEEAYDLLLHRRGIRDNLTSFFPNIDQCIVNEPSTSLGFRIHNHFRFWDAQASDPVLDSNVESEIIELENMPSEALKEKFLIVRNKLLSNFYSNHNQLLFLYLNSLVTLTQNQKDILNPWIFIVNKLRIITPSEFNFGDEVAEALKDPWKKVQKDLKATPKATQDFIEKYFLFILIPILALVGAVMYIFLWDKPNPDPLPKGYPSRM